MKKRVISAVILLAVLITCIFVSTVTRVLFFTVVACMCFYELFNNFRNMGIQCAEWVVYAYVALQAICVFLHADVFILICIYVGCLFTTMFCGIVDQKIGGKGTIYTAFALAYPGLLISMFLPISTSSLWLPTFAIAFISSIICDTFALLGGSRFGKHKLAPAVSPNKTWEGSICGAVAAGLSGILLYFILKPFTPLPMWLCIVSALIASTLGQIGDLAESLIKRYIGVKDFSNLIPGHGGMFDRADSLLFAVPTTYFLLSMYSFYL